MPERWERGVRRFKDVPVPLDDIARKAEQRPPERDEVVPRTRHRAVTALAAFAIFALAASLFLVPVLRSDEPVGTSSTSAAPTPIVPDVVCQVPTLDKTQVLLVGDETVAYPKSALQGYRGVWSGGSRGRPPTRSGPTWPRPPRSMRPPMGGERSRR